MAKAWCFTASSKVAGSTGTVQSGDSGRSLRLGLERCGGARSADRMIGRKHCISTCRSLPNKLNESDLSLYLAHDRYQLGWGSIVEPHPSQEHGLSSQFFPQETRSVRRGNKRTVIDVTGWGCGEMEDGRADDRDHRTGQQRRISCTGECP